MLDDGPRGEEKRMKYEITFKHVENLPESDEMTNQANNNGSTVKRKVVIFL